MTALPFTNAWKMKNTMAGVLPSPVLGREGTTPATRFQGAFQAAARGKRRKSSSTSRSIIL